MSKEQAPERRLPWKHVPYMETSKPTPATAGEWTVTDVLRVWTGERVPKNDHDGMQRLADAINAALADERTLVAWCEAHRPSTHDPIKCCPCCEAVHEREQLAEKIRRLEGVTNQAFAIRKQLDAAVEALKQAEQGSISKNEMAAVLAKIREVK